MYRHRLTVIVKNWNVLIFVLRNLKIDWINSTELRNKSSLTRLYGGFEEHINQLNQAKEPRFFIDYGTDITDCKWNQIFEKWYPNEAVRKPEIIQFNFPWTTVTGADWKNANSKIFSALIKFSIENLIPGGKLIIGMLNENGYNYKDHGFENFKFDLDENFELISTCIFTNEYVTSEGQKNVNRMIELYGEERTYEIQWIDKINFIYLKQHLNQR